MAGPAIVNPTLFRGLTGVTTSAARPVRVGNRPFTERTRGKRPVLAEFGRSNVNSTPNYGNVGLCGMDLPYGSSAQSANANGQLNPGFNPFTSSNGNPLQTGTYTETIVPTGGAGTGISHVTVFYGGADVTAAPTVVFTGGGGSGAAATAIIRDRRVVGVVVTAAGSGYTSAPTVTFTGGGEMTMAPVASVGIGQNVTINTHIPYNVHAPLVTGGYAWFVEILGYGADRLMPCSTSLWSTTTGADDGALDPDQHVNSTFTVATGTNPDGTTGVGIITLAFGVPNNTRVRVYSGPVREIIAQGQHLADITQIKAMPLMWAVIGQASDNSNTNIDIHPTV